MNKKIDVHYVTRLEGHGNIIVEVADGKLLDCRFEVVEAPRFFEAMLRGRHYSEAALITSRICGICSTGHATASLRATEKALGVQLSEQTRMLRKLGFYGEMLDSHILHAYMLVAPDLLGVGSVIPLAASHREVVLRALRLKKLAGDLCAAINGRHTHPIAMTVGGFTHFPSRNTLEALRERLEASWADIQATVELFASLPLPQFERESEYVSLTRPDEYAFIDGEIMTSDGARLPVEDYLKVTNEHVVSHSSAKHTRHRREAYMVGALARFNNNYSQLLPAAKQAAQTLGLKPVLTNPYLNTLAQVVEIAHCVEDACRLIDELLAREIVPEKPSPVQLGAAQGVGACEVPRGLLVHHYWIGADGYLEGADCVIPTNQNVANIEADMRALVPGIASQPEPDIRLSLEMLVRAYDPCISCSVHVMKLSQKRILIVDDDPDLRLALRLPLEAEGYAVTEASGVAEGRKLIKDCRPHLIILDVMMDTTTAGFQFALDVHSADPRSEFKEFSQVPIIMLTAIHSTTPLRFAPDQDYLPVQIFLEKPLDAEVLLANVHALLDK